MTVHGTHRSLNSIVLAGRKWRNMGRDGGPHILRLDVDTGEPVDEGLCGTETVPASQAEEVRVGDDPGGFCQRCFNLYLHHIGDEDRTPYIVQEMHS